MIEFVRQHAVLLSVATFIWFAWSSLNAEDSEKAAEAKKLEGIDADRFLSVRQAHEELPEIIDPYRFGDELPPAPQGPEPKHGPADVAAFENARENELRRMAPQVIPGSLATFLPAFEHAAKASAPFSERLASSVSSLFEPWRGEGGSSEGGRSQDAGGGTGWFGSTPDPVLPTIKLWVDAVLTVGETRQARVSGETAEVGTVLEVLDPSAPPHVVGIEGLEVEVRYRGQSYVLELGGEPLLVQGQSVVGGLALPEEMPR